MAGRRGQVEEAITARAFAVAEPTGRETPGYVEGLRAAISAALDHAIAGVARGVDRAGAIPPPILAQAHNAARSQVGLEIVLRRYAAGYSVLTDFLLEEIRRADASAAAAESILQGELTKLFDLLVETVTREYQDEGERLNRSGARRHTDLLKRLLAGESIDRSRFSYDFAGHHLALIATGTASEPLLREIASGVDRRLLLLEGNDSATSAWLGGRRAFVEDELEELSRLLAPHPGQLIVGEPGHGIRGWRLTHRQARAAYAVAVRLSQAFTRYGEVALLATVSRDEDLAVFLDGSFLSPLRSGRYGGQALPATLRAFLDAGCNVSAAAAALGVTRQTVASRLRVIEHQIGRPVDACLAELDLALRMHDFEG